MMSVTLFAKEFEEMSDHTFYSVENGRNERKLTILSVTGNVGRAPTKEKRISLKLRMPLADNMGAPDWIDKAHTFVGQNHDPVGPMNVDFQGYVLSFAADQTLFGKKGFTASSCRMRGFIVHEVGQEDKLDVVMEFSVRMPFTQSRWNWLGQYNGEEVFIKFVPGEKAEPTRGTTEEDDDSEQESAADDKDEDDAPPAVAATSPPLQFPEPTANRAKKRSGPEDLKKFHEKQKKAAAPKKAPKKKK